MKNLLVIAGAAALLAASSLTALAEEATGTIASIDSAAGTVTLNDGKMFKLPTTVALVSFMPGQMVKITFEGQGTPLSASAISLAAGASGAAAPAGTPAPGAPAPSGANAGPSTNPGAPRD